MSKHKSAEDHQGTARRSHFFVTGGLSWRWDAYEMAKNKEEFGPESFEHLDAPAKIHSGATLMRYARWDGWPEAEMLPRA